MAKKWKFDWKIIIGIIAIILVIILARSLLFGSNNKDYSSDSTNSPSEKYSDSIKQSKSYDYNWEILDGYYDKITECSLKLGTLLNNMDTESASNQISFCQNEVNNALLMVYKWDRNNPSKETKAMKLDYEANSYFLSAYNIIIDYNINSYSLNTFKSRQKQALDLINKYIKNIQLIENSYLYTEYYKRYYKDKERLEESKTIILDLKKQLQELVETCPMEYILVEGYLCYEKCGSGYCQEDYTCCNNECVVCPVGSYLAIDCNCYST